MAIRCSHAFCLYCRYFPFLSGSLCPFWNAFFLYLTCSSCLFCPVDICWCRLDQLQNICLHVLRVSMSFNIVNRVFCINNKSAVRQGSMLMRSLLKPCSSLCSSLCIGIFKTQSGFGWCSSYFCVFGKLYIYFAVHLNIIITVVPVSALSLSLWPLCCPFICRILLGLIVDLKNEFLVCVCFNCTEVV